MKTKDLYDEYMITTMVPGFEPIEVEKASGTTIQGRDGSEYLDCFSGISVTNAGHCHPKVVAAAKEQLDQLLHCCTYIYYNPRAGELAKRLAEITPGRLQKSFLGNSGRSTTRRPATTSFVSTSTAITSPNSRACRIPGATTSGTAHNCTTSAR